MDRKRADEWWQAWQDKPATRTAMKAWEKLKRSDLEDAMTLRRIVTACYFAAHYQPETDPGRVYRAKMAEQREKTAPALARAARALAKAAERHDAALMWAFVQSDPKANGGAFLTRPASDDPVNEMDMAARWFSELARQLEGQLPELHGGPFLNRFTLGNMHRDKPIREGKPTETATMLAFELAFYLRMHTAGRATDCTQSAQRMPTDGRPCADVVAAFVNATLGTSFDRKGIADLLAKVPRDVGLWRWPEAEESP